MEPIIQCHDCAHYRFEDGSCPAFRSLKGIPADILFGKFDHRNAYPGDNGVRWTAREMNGMKAIHPLDAPAEGQEAIIP